MIYYHDTRIPHESVSTSSVVSFIEWLFIFPPSPLTGDQYGKRSRNTPRVVTARVRVYLVSLLIDSAETAAHHLTWSATHDVVSRDINPWKGFNLLMGSNL